MYDKEIKCLALVIIIYFAPRNYLARHKKIFRGRELFGFPDIQRGDAGVIDTMKIHSGNTSAGIWAGMQITQTLRILIL